MSGSAFSVGTRVRIKLCTSSGDSSTTSIQRRLGIIATEVKTDGDDDASPSKSFEVLIDDGNESKEIIVTSADLEHIQDFEHEDFERENAGYADLKDCATILFKRKDFSAAADWYRIALSKIQQSLELGSNVVLSAPCKPKYSVEEDDITKGEEYTGKMAYLSGMISDMSESTVDIILDSEYEGSDELEAVSNANVVPLSSEAPLEQAACHLNLARCHLFLGHPQPARRSTSRALAITHHLLRRPQPAAAAAATAGVAPGGGMRTRTQALLRSAYVVKARAHLAQDQVAPARAAVGAARRLAEAAAAAAGGGTAAAAAAALREVERLERQLKGQAAAVRRRDRRLARDLGRWVQAAVAAGDPPPGGGGGRREGDQDNCAKGINLEEKPALRKRRMLYAAEPRSSPGKTTINNSFFAVQYEARSGVTEILDDTNDSMKPRQSSSAGKQGHHTPIRIIALTTVAFSIIAFFSSYLSGSIGHISSD